jgi:hypothetical protein
MMIWANMHPGFIVGQVTLIFYMIMEGIKFLYPSFRPIEKTAYKRLCLAAVLGIIFSFANPNIYHVWQEYWEYKTPVEHWNLSADYISTLNPDYMSSIQFFVWSNDYGEILFWLTILLAIVGLVVNWKKTDITELAFLTATGFVSFITTRYSFFFMAAALPVIARSFSREGFLNFSRVVILAIALFAGIFFSWGERNNLESLRSGVKIDNYLCPVKAADFIISNNIRGNMYNVYKWGGYLIWRLAPERKVFIDPRDIFEETARESTLMDRAVQMRPRHAYLEGYRPGARHRVYGDTHRADDRRGGPFIFCINAGQCLAACFLRYQCSYIRQRLTCKRTCHQEICHSEGLFD